MADRGAKHLIILSRSGATSKPATDMMEGLTARGVKIMSFKCDASSETSLCDVLNECACTMPPIKGCINAAMVLQDAIFQGNMTYTQWNLTLNSKVRTSKSLNRLLPQNLDFFILLASLAGVAGQMASSNYACGCSFQDALAHHRVAHGQKCLSLDIGWMRNIGIIAETGAYQRQRQAADDMQPIEDTDLLALLTVCCDPTSSELATPQAQSQVLFGLRTPADALVEGKPVPALLDRPLFAPFSYIVGGSGTPPQGTSAYDNSPTATALFRTSTDSGERSQAVVRALAAKLARAMAISPGDVEPSKPLSSYGVDSLMAVGLRNWIKREFGATLAIFEIMDGYPLQILHTWFRKEV